MTIENHDEQLFRFTPAEEVLPFVPGQTLQPELTHEGPLPDTAGGGAVVHGSVWRQIVRVFAENKLAVASLFFLIFIVLFCFVGPHFYHSVQDNQQAVIDNPVNAPPEKGFPLGTDNDGFDILGRIMYGGQVSLIVGFLSAAVATIVGVGYGAAAGFFGGWLDAAMMRVVDIVLSIPVLFLLICLVTVFHSSEGLLIVVIAAVSWLVPARLLRGETLSLRTREYVQAVRGMGGRGEGSSGATSSRTRWGRSSSSPPSRSPTRSCSWPPSASWASASRSPRPTGERCSRQG